MRVLGMCLGRFLGALSLSVLAARGSVDVTNVRVTQREGAKLVDITYDVASSATNRVAVSLVVSNGVATVSATSLTGAVGADVATGMGRSIVWDAGADWNGNVAALSYTISADDGTADPTSGLYLVVDLSGGTSAVSYPVSSLAEVPAGGWTEEYKTSKLVLRRIAATSPDFTMGSPANELGRNADEVQHQVSLTQGFFIGVFEVTQRQWELVMGTRPSAFTNAAHYAARPVEVVSYYDIREAEGNADDPAANWPSNRVVNATSFMGRLRTKTGLATFDLPTEAQWEYACRAGTTTALNSGYNLTNRYSDPRMDVVGRYSYNGGSTAAADCAPSSGTATAGTYLANAWGLYDMHGNVWEWCLDWYATYPGSGSDPKGAVSSSTRVFRGAGWNGDSNTCRSARRTNYPPTERLANVGFRAALQP